jgi:hypothetical protein
MGKKLLSKTSKSRLYLSGRLNDVFIGNSENNLPGVVFRPIWLKFLC